MVIIIKFKYTERHKFKQNKQGVYLIDFVRRF